MSAHRYWRVFVYRTVNNNFNGFSEIELRTAVSGADQTGSGTAAASSSFNGSTLPANAVDNSSATIWMANAATSVWWSYDFGSGVTKDIVEVALTSRNDASFADCMAYGAIQYSDDNATWTTAFYMVTTAWTQNQTKTFTIPGAGAAHRYWRLNVLSIQAGTTTGQVVVQELRMRKNPGGATVTSGGTAIGSSNNGNVYANAFDDDSLNWTSAVGGSWPQYIGYDFGSGNTAAIESMGVRCADSATATNYTSNGPKSFSIDCSDDNVTWRPVYTSTTNDERAWLRAEERVFVIPQTGNTDESAAKVLGYAVVDSGFTPLSSARPQVFCIT